MVGQIYQIQCVSTHFVGIYCHFALSSMQLEYIALIVNYIHFSGLLNYVHFATKQPLKPTSIHVQQMPFYKTSDLQVLSQTAFAGLPHRSDDSED